MKLHTGIITKQIQESKKFYTEVLDFEIKFESEWFILLNVKNKPNNELALMLPNQTQTRKTYFQEEYQKGIWFILEVESIKNYYEKIKTKKVKIDLELTEEEWGDIHFTILDPNGIGIDIVEERKS
ncbi:MAG TPA: VOC family protein [Leptospiraceae bacterium]|nr:VOC family protein [Leptospiraceae bacterium]HMW06081.1 VOC family protein [Leptospiraceae bacterium]HMX33369.1 VOC family protein [Leptospiraceae bacterium]HMY31377.1 VOC family protein [Leptospiraceae bacterium]HMZ65003.1 VOC family protein [Leptospiraceae bacterium]